MLSIVNEDFTTKDLGVQNVSLKIDESFSMFVLLPGKSRAHAFAIGQEIAKAVTSANPSPVTLQMEKVRIRILKINPLANLKYSNYALLYSL